MLLTIDIGNTNIVVGLFDGDHLRNSARLSTRSRMTPDEGGYLLSAFLRRAQVASEQINKIVIASVVPALTTVFEDAAQLLVGRSAVIVSPDIKLPITIDFDRPEQVGADRITNAAAGFVRFGGPLIVVDFGTATTFDIVSADGAYIGGVIIPGPQTSMAELARRAARLFEVKLERPETVVGRSTEGALQSGLFYGTIGQVDYIIDCIVAETEFEGPTVVATGGLASGIEKSSRHISQIEPDLTLEGLRLIADLN